MEGMIYLLRHGRMLLPEDGRFCIGRGSDPELSYDGRKEAVKLRDCFPDLERIYCGPLTRMRETARITTDKQAEIIVLPEFTDIDVGEWEGMDFRDIRKKYPDIYRARGRDWSIPPVGGESLESAADRIQSAVMSLAERNKEEVAVVTSDGAIRALLWRLMRLDTRHDTMIQEPYGSITALRYENGALTVTAIGKLPEDSPDDAEIEELWDLCGTPQGVRDHSAAVCELCIEIREKLISSGIVLSYGRLRTAAMLHDVCRSEGNLHAAYAANLLRERGYLSIARLIEQHHDGYIGDKVDESIVLYLADKMTNGTERVTLEERFGKSLAKCRTDEAKAMHRMRLDRAIEVQKKIEDITGKL